MKTHALIAHAGSLRTLLVLMAALAVLVLIEPGAWPLGLLFGALGLNLLAALVVHPAFRRQLPLLVAHLALLALLGLVAWGRLASLDGRFELTEGVRFDGRLLDQRAGPLHEPRLQALAFMHHGFEIDYAAGRRRGPTRNLVRWTADDGLPRSAVIGDHRPLVIAGHRIYTSPNKGFAPLLRWQPDGGVALRGAVHLPSFPAQELAQWRTWALPDGREVWVQLHTDELLIDPSRAGRFRLPQSHRLVVRQGDARAELAPGESLALPGGRLVYEGLRTWMGYRVAYDPSLPWLLAAALLASLALALHYTLRLREPGPALARPVHRPAHG